MNASSPFAPDPLSIDLAKIAAGAAQLPHPDLPWSGGRKQTRELFTAVEEQLRKALKVTSGSSRIFSADPIAAYCAFYSLFIDRWAEHPEKGPYMMRIVYFTTLPSAAVAALKYLDRTKRVKAIAYQPRWDGRPDERLREVMNASPNALLLSAPYISPTGQKLTASDVATSKSAANAALETPVHLDLSYCCGAEDLSGDSAINAPVYTADLSYCSLVDTYLIFMADTLRDGVGLILDRLPRESAIAAATWLALQRDAAKRIADSAGAGHDFGAALSSVRTQVPGALVVPYSTFRRSSIGTAVVTLGDMGAPETSYSGSLLFFCVKGGRPVSAQRLQERALTGFGAAKQAYIHTVNLAESVVVDEIEKPFLRELLLITRAPPCLVELLVWALAG